MSSFFCVVLDIHDRLWINLEIRDESQLSWTMLTFCNDYIYKRWHESLNIRGQHLPNDIRNDDICDSERILNLIPIANLSWIISALFLNEIGKPMQHVQSVGRVRCRKSMYKSHGEMERGSLLVTRWLTESYAYQSWQSVMNLNFSTAQLH